MDLRPQHYAEDRQARGPVSSRTHLCVDDVGDVPGGEQGHPDVLQQVRQGLFSLLLGVLHPVDDGLKDRLFRIHLSENNYRPVFRQSPHRLKK